MWSLATLLANNEPSLATIRLFSLDDTDNVAVILLMPSCVCSTLTVTGLSPLLPPSILSIEATTSLVVPSARVIVKTNFPFSSNLASETKLSYVK